MVYQIDVAINLNKISNLSEIKLKLLEKANECKLENIFYNLNISVKIDRFLEITV